MDRQNHRFVEKITSLLRPRPEGQD